MVGDCNEEAGRRPLLGDDDDAGLGVLRARPLDVRTDRAQIHGQPIEHDFAVFENLDALRGRGLVGVRMATTSS